MNGMRLLCDIMKKGALKKLTHLDVSRNNSQYGGIHKLAKIISTLDGTPGGAGYVPHLKHLNIR